MVHDIIPARRSRLIVVLGLSVLFSLGLLGARITYTGSPAFSFLVWNLFLASVPLILSSVLIRDGILPRSKLARTVTFAGWLLFFPNAPYLLTDLLHLGSIGRAPLWFDLILLLSFSSCGLILGFLSLADMQEIVGRWFGAAGGTAFAAVALVLGAFGIYLGRFLRWNSWDVMTRPRSLFGDIARHALDPGSYPKVLVVTFLLSSLFALWYFAFRLATRDSVPAFPALPAILAGSQERGHR